MFIHELWSDKFLKMETVPEKSPKISRKKSAKTQRWINFNILTVFRPKIYLNNAKKQLRNPTYAINEILKSRIQIFWR